MSSSGNRKPQQHRGPRRQAPAGLSSELLGEINLKQPGATMFDDTAEQIAKKISDCSAQTNRSTQLRRFYDEVCTWDAKIKQKPEDFAKYLPLIRMLNAKVAYAEGRKLVDAQFKSLMRDCLRKVEDVSSFNNFKLFFEAFLGFYKVHKPN